ncbi:MAG: prolyl endopeptidase [Deltaproteobacteria bacterium RIFOXYA12_FULL_58_15]|nr:MAG: prolyl endopeptidase [Deltaproteobacteria bacterium RIFOXYA12_FULL_58_15]
MGNGCKHAPAPKPSGVYDNGIVYPLTKQVEHADNYHGVMISDPYRWLEDLDSADTAEWVKKQNDLTFSYLEKIPQREALKKRLTQLWNFERYGVPFRRGGRVFFSKNDGLQDQAVFYWAESIDAEPKVLIDPNTLSKDGTVALSNISVSNDGRFVAYGLQIAGSDWVLWKIRNVDTGRDLSDNLKWIKFSQLAWTSDNEGLFYSRYPKPKKGATYEQPNYNNKLYFHRLGTEQHEDELVFEYPQEKEWRFDAIVTDDGLYVIVLVSKGTDDRYRVMYKRLDVAGARLVELIGNFDYEYTPIGSQGPVLYFKTTNGAPRGRVIAIDTRDPNPDSWREVVPQKHATIDSVSMLGGQLIVGYLVDAHNEVEVLDLDGNLQRNIELPGIGSAWGFDGRQDDSETFFAFSSFARPTSIHRYDIRSGAVTLFREPKVAFNPADYETTQLFATSKDGTRVPLFVTHKKGLELDGKRPTYLYGYGGFNISITPWFQVSTLVWMEMGGVYAVASLRGGGEYGEQWHEAGRLANKQNVFDDFAACAEHLISAGYTSTPKLAIGGGSNGGLLVGASVTQRPDLFGAAIAQVGVLDMLRFHKFTIGWAWTDDYGSSDDPDGFKVLRAYSPLHNLKTGTHYPATLLVTADHDDRVVPSHSFKFAAAMQAAQSGDAPVLIRIETRAGHGAGKPTSKQIEEVADSWSFLLRELGID